MFFINHTDIGEGSAVIIEIEGPLNSESTPDFYDYINILQNKNVYYLLIDMKNIKFISSEGIGAALMIQKCINEKNGLAVFFNLNFEIKSLFTLLGFDKLFTIADDRADALSLLDRRMELSPPEIKEKNLDIIENIPETNFPEETPASINEIPDSRITTENKEITQKEIIEFEEKFDSFIIECVKCRSLIRVKESGDQLCPYCNTEFLVTDEKKAVFKI